MRILKFTLYFLLGLTVAACNDDLSSLSNPDKINNESADDAFLTGADLSYANQIQKHGGVYRDQQGGQVDPFSFIADKGAKIARIRLWHTPENITNSCGDPVAANNLADVTAAFKKAQAANMQLLLSIHYGDYFNDPGKQTMPASWSQLNQKELVDAIGDYTTTVLQKLHDNGVAPDIVAIGNETTWGFVDAGETTDGWSWPDDADKFNMAFASVDKFNADNHTDIKKAVHFTENTAVWLMNTFAHNNITNFDIIGLSYYPHNSELTSLQALGELISELKNSYKKDVLIMETGAPWTVDSADNYNNFINDFGNLPYPVTPSGQKNYLLDLALTVKNNGGIAVIYWQPTWIASDLCDLWGRSSSYENASFFDFNRENRALPATDFFSFFNHEKEY